MKIQCDVCSKEDAAVYCTADEAALCHGCDRRVHHANKLASKHPRFSLVHPSPSSFSMCDICQEKRAFLFCQQDRAILCKDCDVSIHSANELTLKHNRFLLTGVKLSATPSVFSADSGDLVPDFSSSSPAANVKPHQPPQSPTNNNSNSNINKNNTTTTTNNNNWGQTIVPDDNCSTISEYLMEMLPGWHVEDLLQATTTPSSTPLGFSSTADGGLFSFGETDGEADSNISNNSVPSSASERFDFWVPEAPPAANFLHPQLLGFNNNKEKVGANRRWATEDLFAVPQISPPPSGVGFKRSRPF